MKISTSRTTVFPKNASWITKNQKGLRVLAVAALTTAAAIAFFALALHGGIINPGQPIVAATGGVFMMTGITLSLANKSIKLFGTIQKKQKKSHPRLDSGNRSVIPLPKNLRAAG